MHSVMVSFRPDSGMSFSSFKALDLHLGLILGLGLGLGLGGSEKMYAMQQRFLLKHLPFSYKHRSLTL